MPATKYWDGSQWVYLPSSPQVVVSPDPPSPRSTELFWLDTDEAAPATLNVTMDTWHLVGASGEPAFTAFWANYSASTDGMVGFRKSPDGKVQIKGIAQISSGGGATIFTLPVGYRPARPWRFCVAGMGGPTYFVVNVDGSVTQQNVSGYYALTANAWYDLSVIEFDTESVLQTVSAAAQPLDSWHTVGAAGEPALSAGFTIGEPVAFRKSPDGRVVLRGQVVNPSIALNGVATAFTLPVGYRPPTNYRRFIVPTVTGGNATSWSRVYIGLDGAVQIENNNGSAYWDLGSIEFDTESVSSYTSAFINGPQRVSSLPSSPFDGQEIYYRFQQTVNPVDAVWIVWHLIYDATTGAWLPVGRQEPVYAHRGITESFAFSSANAWGGINVNDPQVTVPRAGDYDVEFGCGTMLGGAVNMWVGLRVAGVDPGNSPGGGSDGNYVSGAQTSATWDKSGPGHRKITGIAASATIQQRYQVSGATTVQRGGAYIKAFPRRITG